MTDEPRDKHFDSPLSEWIEGFSYELETDAVALSSVVTTGRQGFGFKGEALAGFVRQALTGILEHGGRPVHGGGEGPQLWILLPHYGSQPAEILEAVMAEWVAAGMPTGDLGGLWFALPESCEPEEPLQQLLDRSPALAAEPRDRHSGLPLSLWLETGWAELENGAVALRHLATESRDGFGFGGEALTGFLRRALSGLLEHGGRPVRVSEEGVYRWIPDPRYGSQPAEILETVMREWVESGAAEDPAGPWFALPDRPGMPLW